jgi:hypothetical protein
MENEDILESLRELLSAGQVTLASTLSPQQATKSLLFFESVPTPLLEKRRAVVQGSEMGGEWFLVTDRPCSSQWLLDAEDLGILVATVADLAKVRAELETLGAAPLEPTVTIEALFANTRSFPDPHWDSEFANAEKRVLNKLEKV